jgi:hypothetical protein
MALLSIIAKQKSAIPYSTNNLKLSYNTSIANMKVAAAVTLLFATLAVANPMGEVVSSTRMLLL